MRDRDAAERPAVNPCTHRLARAAAILERHTLQGRDAMTSLQAVRDYLRTRLSCLPHEVFVCLRPDTRV